MPIDSLRMQAPAVIARYASTLHAAACEEHHVVSGLGAWLVLALAGQAGMWDADGGGDIAARGAVEAALGVPVAEAGRLAVDLLGGLSPTVVAAIGLWWREDVATDRLTAYAGRLPRGATREPLTGQAQLDAWARERTLGLIDSFPLQVTPELMLLLASAVATRVTWWRPFDVVPASELAAAGSRGGFADTVTRALRSVPGQDVRLVNTRAAGLVGAHVAASGDGLAVVSVLGAADVDRAAMLAAAHEVALGLDATRIGRIGQWVSLFEVPAGRSELGEIVEETVTIARGSTEEGFAVLPTWHAKTDIDLLEGPTADGFRGAGHLLAGLLPPGPKQLDARQSAVASYTREGFEAAAITRIAVPASAPVPRQVLRRTLALRFDRPYAAVAVAVEPPHPRDRAGVDDGSGGQPTARFVLPVFSAWVAEPAETPPVGEVPDSSSLRARLRRTREAGPGETAREQPPGSPVGQPSSATPAAGRGTRPGDGGRSSGQPGMVGRRDGQASIPSGDRDEVLALSRVPLRNKDDVREEFVAPLLRLLGYQHALGQVLRGQRLSTAHRSEAERKERIVADYIARTDLGCHLVLQVKGPGKDPDDSRRAVTDRRFVSRAHSYAAHREVNAPRFALTNGHYVAVYDTNSASFDPILLVAQEQLPDRIDGLRRTLGKQATAGELTRRLAPAWTTQVAARKVGFQPMNLDVGDVNHDGLPEIAVAISEDHVPVLDLRGNIIADHPLTGWAWWLKFTHSLRPGRATLVVLQHHSGAMDMRGRVIGFDGRDQLWQYELERPGSGFEDLDRLLLDGPDSIIVGPACGSSLIKLSHAGEEIWASAMSDPRDPLASIMHLVPGDGGTLLATVSNTSGSWLVRVNRDDGSVASRLSLPFRGGRVSYLGSPPERYALVASTDTREMAVVDLERMTQVRILTPEGTSQHPATAIDPTSNLVVITDYSVLRAYELPSLREGELACRWTTHDVPGVVQRGEWHTVGSSSTLVVCTAGMAASPQPNGLYLLTASGQVYQQYLLPATPLTEFKQAGFRAMLVRDVDGDGLPEVLAVSDDSMIYLWRPDWTTRTRT